MSLITILVMVDPAPQLPHFALLRLSLEIQTAFRLVPRWTRLQVAFSTLRR